jgi:hypothetical protein
MNDDELKAAWLLTVPEDQVAQAAAGLPQTQAQRVGRILDALATRTAGIAAYVNAAAANATPELAQQKRHKAETQVRKALGYTCP